MGGWAQSFAFYCSDLRVRAHRARAEGKHRSSMKKKALGRRKNQVLVSTVSLQAQKLSSLTCCGQEERTRNLFPAFVCLKILSLWPVVSALWLTKHLLQGVGPAVRLTGLLLTCFHEPTTAKRNYLLLEAEDSVGTLANNHWVFFFLPNTSAHCICLCGIFFSKALEKAVTVFIWNTYRFPMTNIGCECSLTSHYNPSPEAEVNHRLCVSSIQHVSESSLWTFMHMFLISQPPQAS